MQIKHLIVGPLLTNCYLISSQGESVVIDPGGDVDEILKEVKKTKTKVKYIINTHFHPDHTAGNLKLKELTGAKVIIYEEEKGFIKFEVDEFLKEGDEIKFGNAILKVIQTPGHSKGGISLLGENALFTGDTLFKNGYGRTDLPGGSQKDLEKSLDKLSKLFKPGMIVYPGHGDIFKIR